FARHLRVIGRGNSQSLWNSITEAAFHAHPNLPPAAAGITLETPEGHTAAADLLAAASDADALPFPLRLLHLSPPQYGTAVITGATAAITPADGFVGGETLIYQISDGHRVGEAPLSIRITRPTTLAGFLNRHFTPAEQADSAIGGPAADPDGDQLPSLLEFALGSDPREAAVRPLLEVGNGTMSLTLTVDLLARDIELMPEWSADLREWHRDGFVTEALGEADGLRALRLTLATDDSPRAFIRLRARVAP
ncbi:MAG: Ig-like domain-containing protein, partial [Akkermansiaceae bacterium]|nr:Ig-like domain-containing protein [Akkermansiaceae bacterium]